MTFSFSLAGVPCLLLNLDEYSVILIRRKTNNDIEFKGMDGWSK